MHAFTLLVETWLVDKPAVYVRTTYKCKFHEENDNEPEAVLVAAAFEQPRSEAGRRRFSTPTRQTTARIQAPRAHN